MILDEDFKNLIIHADHLIKGGYPVPTLDVYELALIMAKEREQDEYTLLSLNDVSKKVENDK